jgi:hypothetical protein
VTFKGTNKNGKIEPIAGALTPTLSTLNSYLKVSPGNTGHWVTPSVPSIPGVPICSKSNKRICVNEVGYNTSIHGYESASRRKMEIELYLPVGFHANGLQGSLA